MINTNAKIIILFLIATSLICKFTIRDQGLPRFGTYDTECFRLAHELYPSFISDIPEEYEKYLEVINSSEPTKYPLLLTKLYLHTSKLLNFQFTGTQAIIFARLIHISFFALTLSLFFLLPLEKNVKWVAAGLFSCSLIMHHYSSILKIHPPTSFFVFSSFLINLHLLRSRHVLLMIFFSAIFTGLAIGTFYTGIVGLFGLWTVFYIKNKQQELSKIKTLIYAILSSGISLIVFSMFRPSLLPALKGETNFFKTDDYPDSYFDPTTLKYYLHEFILFDPFIFVGYLVGLFYLYKKREMFDPKWLVCLTTCIPYHLALGILNGTNSRRTTLVMPIVVIISAYGLIHLYKKRRKFIRILLGVLALFTILSLIKHTYVANHDSRTFICQSIKEYIPEHSTFIQDFGVPNVNLSFEDNEKTPYKWDRLDPYKYRNLSAKEFCQFLKSNGYSYYVSNVNLKSLYKVDFDKNLSKHSKLLTRVDTNSHSIFPVENMEWPNCGAYFLWRLWFLKRSGSTFEIYQMLHSSEQANIEKKNS